MSDQAIPEPECELGYSERQLAETPRRPDG